LGLVPHMYPYSLKLPPGLMSCSHSGLRSCFFEHGGQEGAWRDYGFMWGTWSKEVLRWVLAPMECFYILGYLLQWRWQWASIGHFVFLFNFCPSFS
jgi:hypothetical protein